MTHSMDLLPKESTGLRLEALAYGLNSLNASFVHDDGNRYRVKIVPEKIAEYVPTDADLAEMGEEFARMDEANLADMLLEMQ